MAPVATVKKTFTKYSFVSTKLDAKVLVNGKIKSANSGSNFRSLKLVLTSVNQLGKALNSLNSGLVQFSESVTKVSQTLVKDGRKEGIYQKKILRLSSEELKSDKKRSDDEKTRGRRQLDKGSEDASEKDPLGLKKETEKKVIKPSLGIFDVLKNFAQLLVKYAVVSGVLKWMMDPKNTEKLGKLAVGLGKVFKFFWDITSAIGGLIASGVSNLGAGIFDTAQGLAKGDVGQVFRGLGEFVQAIPGLLVLRWVLNPMSLIKDISGILNTIGLGDKPEKPPTPDGRKPPKPISQRRVGTTRRYIRREFNKGVTKTADTLNKIPGKLGDAFKSGMGWLGEKTKGVRTGVGKGVDWVSEQYKRMAKMGDSIGKGAMEKLKGAGEAIQKKASEVTKPLMDTAKRILDEKGITKMAQELGTKAMNVIKKLPGYDKITKKIAQEGGEGMLKKLGGKAIPVIGGLVNLYFAYDRLKRGDKTGAILEAISAVLDIAGLVTGGSTSVASMVIDGYLFGRDFFPDMVKKENEVFDSILGFLNPIKAAQKILPQVPKFEKGGIVGPGGQTMDPKLVGATLTDTTIKTLQDLGPGGRFVETVLGGELSQLKSSFGESKVLVTSSKLAAASKKPNKELTQRLLGGGDSNISDLMGKKAPQVADGQVSSDTTVAGLFASVVGVMSVMVNKDFKVGGGAGGGGDSSGDGDGGGDSSGGNANIQLSSSGYLDLMIETMNKGGIKNPNERVMFMAQVGHESGEGRYMEEIASGAAYEGRSDLGNTQPGDGKRYKGRGYIQITGRNNYRTYGPKAGVPDAEQNPKKLAEPKNAAKVALAYWLARVNRAAAAKGMEGMNTVTRNINGGLNGLEDRIAKYKKYEKMDNIKKMAAGGGVPPGVGEPMPLSPKIKLDPRVKGEAYGGLLKFANGGQFKNGQLPDNALEGVGRGHKVRKGDVADSFKEMAKEAKKDGINLVSDITSSYRTFAEQVATKERHGRMAATPGYSKHGWGVALDIGYPRSQDWINKKGAKFGWSLPDWAKPGGSLPEPWHFEKLGAATGKSGGAPDSSGNSGTTESGGGNQQQSAPQENWWDVLGKAFSGETAAALVGSPAPATSTTPAAAATPASPTAPSTEPPKKAEGGVVNFNNPSFGVDKQNKLNADSFVKNSLTKPTPMQQWAKAHPQLAKKVKPGQSGYLEIQAVINPSSNLVINESPKLPDESVFTKNKVLILNNFRTKVVQTPGPQIVRTTAFPQACYDSFFNN